MGREACAPEPKLRKGLWSPEEDEKLYNYITRFGIGCWSSVPKLAGLQRCGKSCRLRWINYLRPDLKRGMFSQQEEEVIIRLHEVVGNRWAQIAAQLPGRTDNEIKNFWNSYLKKKLAKQGIDPNTHTALTDAENFREEPSLPLPPLKPLSASAHMEQGILSRTGETFLTTPSFDSMGYAPDFQTHRGHPILEASASGFPPLPSFQHGSIGETDFSENSTSRIGALLLNDVMEGSLLNGIAGGNPWEALYECHLDGARPDSWKEQGGQILDPHAMDDSASCFFMPDDMIGAHYDAFHHL